MQLSRVNVVQDAEITELFSVEKQLDNFWKLPMISGGYGL